MKTDEITWKLCCINQMAVIGSMEIILQISQSYLFDDSWNVVDELPLARHILSEGDENTAFSLCDFIVAM